MFFDRAALFPTLFLLKSLYYHVAAHFREVVDEEFSVAVIRFVKEGPGCVAFSFAFEPFALLVLGLETGFQRADDDRRDFADGEAAFVTRLLALRVGYFGVRGDQFYPVAIHYKQAQIQPDLRRRKANTLRVFVSSVSVRHVRFLARA